MEAVLPPSQMVFLDALASLDFTLVSHWLAGQSFEFEIDFKCEI